MTASSRTSLFSPGTTIRGASPGLQLGLTTHDWSRKSIEGGQMPYTPQQYGAGTAVAMMNNTQSINGANLFKNSEGRGMRRMISLENENPRGS